MLTTCTYLSHKPQAQGNFVRQGKLRRTCMFRAYWQLSTNLICVEDLQESLVDVWLPLEPILNLVDIVDGMIKLYWLIVLQGWGGSKRDCHRCMRLHRWRAWWCIWWDWRSLLAGWSMCLQLWWLRRKDILSLSERFGSGKFIQIPNSI